MKYKNFTMIKSNYKKRQLKNLNEFKKTIREGKTENIKELWVFRQLTEKQKNLTLKDIKTILINKAIKEHNKDIEQFFKKCDEIAAINPAKDILIKVNWTKNRSWGANPHAEIWAAGQYTTGTASGCGYDKLSSAIANAFNKNNNILNLIYNKYEKALRKNKNISLREAVGYGSGYQYPYFDGGVGYSCFKSIFDELGAKVNTWQEGKTWDCMTIEF